jgi:FKBP-type peptidyl-prolyl cis-trans isomerase SlyD
MSIAVGPDTFVTIQYDLRDGRGNLLESTEDPAEFVWGYDTLLPALESALEGMTRGEVVNLSLEPEDAYGTRDEEGVFAVAKDEFPTDAPLEEGNEYSAEGEDGTVLTMRVVEIHDEHVMVDTNHPLAGERLNFQVRVLDVRRATDDEILAARAESSEVGEQFAGATEGLPS